MELFNTKITKSANLAALESKLKEAEKAIKSLLSAIEQGIISKAIKDVMLKLESQKRIRK